MTKIQVTNGTGIKPNPYSEVPVTEFTESAFDYSNFERNNPPLPVYLPTGETFDGSGGYDCEEVWQLYDHDMKRWGDYDGTSNVTWEKFQSFFRTTRRIYRLINPVGEGEKERPKVVCYCGSLRVAAEAFKKAEYESVLRGEIALLPCCMFVDIQREYGAESDYKIKADDLHKRKIDICDEVFVLNVDDYIGESTRSEIDYAISISKPVKYLEA